MSAPLSNSPEPHLQSLSLYRVLEEGEIPCFKNASEYLEKLDEVVLGSLLEEDRNCTICQEPYGTGEEPETILTLPCKHMFGSSCLQHWLVDAGKQTCPCCRAQLFHLETVRSCRCGGMIGYLGEHDDYYCRYPDMPLDYDDDNENDGEDRFIMPEVNDLLDSGSGTLDDVDRVVAIISYLIGELEAWEVIPADHPNASRQLRALFWELRDRGFELPERYIMDFALTFLRLYHLLQDMLESMGEPMGEMEIVLAWAGGYFPLNQVVVDRRLEYGIELALDQMIDAECRVILENAEGDRGRVVGGEFLL